MMAVSKLTCLWRAQVKKPSHKYESEDVQEPDRDVTKTGQAQLVVGDAPSAPEGGSQVRSLPCYFVRCIGADIRLHISAT